MYATIHPYTVINNNKNLIASSLSIKSEEIEVSFYIRSIQLQVHWARKFNFNSNGRPDIKGGGKQPRKFWGAKPSLCIIDQSSYSTELNRFHQLLLHTPTLLLRVHILTLSFPAKINAVIYPQRVTLTHRVGRVLSFFSSRRNWDSPNPSPAGECAPLPPVLGGGAHSLAREWLGESQFRRRT